jgi:acetylglutamate kinase
VIDTTLEQALGAEEKARVLSQALPYIRTYKGHTVVIKLGGEALDDPSHAALVASDLALLGLVGMRLVVVHGGGPQVSAAMSEAGLEPIFVSGLRVTDDAAMETVRRVLVGSINSDLVSRLCAAGLQAVGLSGADASLVEAVPLHGPAEQSLGRVGRVSRVRAGVLDDLLETGYTPVVASVAPGPEGGFLNINADAAAAALASALHAAKLVYVTNVPGLYADFGDDGSLLSELDCNQLQAMLPGLSAGMHPKASSSVEALQHGVGKVHILDGRVEHALLLEIFTDEGIGTQVLP